jgi:hypothetical protein
MEHKFKVGNVIVPNRDPEYRHKVLEVLESEHEYHIRVIGDACIRYEYWKDIDEIEKEWQLYKKPKKVIPTFVRDNFDNEVRAGDAVYYVCGRGINGRIHEIKMGVVTGFTEKNVVLDTGAYVEPCKMGKIGVSVGNRAIDKCI